jgi:thioredoxin reductase
MHCSNLAADALHDAIKNWRSGTRLTPLSAEAVASSGVGCGVREVSIVEGVGDFEGRGVFKRVEDVAALADKRVLVLDKGPASAKLALALTAVTPRVVFLTELDALGLPSELANEVKRSDVKVLYQSRLLAVRGEGEVERVLVNDLDEDSEYELFVDAVVMLEV